MYRCSYKKLFKIIHYSEEKWIKVLAKFKILPQPSAKLLRLKVVRPVET